MYSVVLSLSAGLLVLQLVTLTDGATTDAPNHGVVTMKAGDNVTLACALNRGDEQFEGIMWRKEGMFQVSLNSKKEVKYVDDTLANRMSVEDNNGLLLKELVVADSANYTCELFVLNTSQVEERNISWELFIQDVPSPPGRPDLVEIQARQVTVRWTPSEFYNNSPISNYIIQISECQDGDSSTKREVVVAGTTLQVTIRELLPYTCYRVQVRARNSIGRSFPGPMSNFFYTESEAPSAAPEKFQAVSNSSSEICLTWEPPSQEALHGDLRGFKVTYNCLECNIESQTVDEPGRTMVLDNLQPYTWYTVSILAYNDEGDGPMAEVAVQTLEGLPSSPRITHITNRDSTSFYVHWEPPKKLRGRLTAYELHWILDDESPKTRIISGHLTNPMSAFITGLRPYTEYKIQVAAVTGGGRGPFSEKYPALTDIAAPSAPFIRNVTILSPTKVYIQWDPPTVYFRRVDKYILKWWDTRGNDPDTMVPGTQTDYTLELTTNMRYHIKVAGVTQALFSKRFLVGEFTSPVVFTLGDLNRQAAKEDDVPTEIIAGVTCAIIVVLIVVIVFIGYRSFACRKCYQAAYYYLAVPSNTQSTPPTVITVAEPSEEKEYPEIPVSEFPAHVEAMHADSDFAFSQEFDDLYRHTRTDFKCEASNTVENRNKNRYINIAAFDHSRVLLKMDLGRLRQSDYINANYVDGYKKPKAYIATQGPLPQTFADFWRMVWEQNCTVIVMITNLMEKGRRKCDQYWPADGLELYGNMSVKLLSTMQRAHYTVNVFSLRNMKRHSMKSVSERTVYQYHYTEWPDHGVPDYTLPVLEFVQKSAACNPADGGPIVVHCSAGVGRTGTYILIDSMIRQIQDCSTVNIPGFTLHIRRQRNLLVQTEDQYMFIHDVLVEYLMGGGQTEVTEENISTYIASLTASANGVVPHEGKVPDTCSTLEKQYKLVTSYTPSEDDTSNAQKPCNTEKNRSAEFVPVNLKRVILPARPGVEGSDYINATYLQGYRKSDEFIVTQYPLETTREDFWRMVWDKNSPVVIILTSSEEPEMPEFWPEKGSPVEVDAGNFKLSMKDDPDIQPSHVIRDFILESIQYDYIFMTKVIVVTEWPDTSPPFYPVFCMIENAIEWQRANDIGPVIVMDTYGGVRVGRFCALWALRDQLMMDKAVDVYQLAKLYHLKRPGIIGTQDDFRYLYEAVSCLQDHLREEEGSVSSSSPRHHSSSRKNGTLPRSSTIQNNTGKTETNI